MLKGPAWLRMLDSRLLTYFQSSDEYQKSGIKRSLAVIIGHSGDSWIWIIGLGLLCLYGESSVNSAACIMIIGILITAAVTFIIKYAVRRERPAGKRDSLYIKIDPYSFPSGHAARAAVITTISFWICPLWVTLLLLIWTFLLCVTRMILKIHYFSDILAGIGVGTAVALLVLQISWPMTNTGTCF
jgi:membrane-associated phospholipid phosphatase